MENLINEITTDLQTLGSNFQINESVSKYLKKYNVGDSTIRHMVTELMKSTYSYNLKHVDSKYSDNDEFVEFINPKSILDLFAGTCYYEKYKKNGIEVVQNDINGKDNDMLKSYNFDYTIDADKLLGKFIYENKKFDIVDIDPFSSPIIYVQNAIKIAKKGIIVTFGDFSMLKLPKMNKLSLKMYINRVYGVRSITDLSIEKAIRLVQQIGGICKKRLEVFKISKNSNHYRVYFKISNLQGMTSTFIRESKKSDLYICDYSGVLIHEKKILDSIKEYFKNDYERIKNEISMSLIDDLTGNSLTNIYRFHHTNNKPFNSVDYIVKILEKIDVRFRNCKFKKMVRISEDGYWECRRNRIELIVDIVENQLNSPANDPENLISIFRKSGFLKLMKGLRNYFYLKVGVPVIYLLFEAYPIVLEKYMDIYLTPEEISCINNNGNILELPKRKIDWKKISIKITHRNVIDKAINIVNNENIKTAKTLLNRCTRKTIFYAENYSNLKYLYSSYLEFLMDVAKLTGIECTMEDLIKLNDKSRTPYKTPLSPEKYNLLHKVKTNPSLKLTKKMYYNLTSYKSKQVNVYEEIIKIRPDFEVKDKKIEISRIIEQCVNDKTYTPTKLDLRKLKEHQKRNSKYYQELMRLKPDFKLSKS